MLFTEGDSKSIVYHDFFMIQSRFVRNISFRFDLISFETRDCCVPLEVIYDAKHQPIIHDDAAASTIIYDSN